MAHKLPDGLMTRHPTPEDQPRVLAVMDDWWAGFQGEAGSLRRTLLLPRLYFQHFTDSSYLVERDDGRLVAFLNRQVKCITSPGNRASLAFHTGIGFDVESGRA